MHMHSSPYTVSPSYYQKWNILPKTNPPPVPGSQPLTHPRELYSSYDSFLHHHLFSLVHHSASMQVCCKSSHLSKRPFSMSISVGLHPAFGGPVPAPLFSTTPSKGALWSAPFPFHTLSPPHTHLSSPLLPGFPFSASFAGSFSSLLLQASLFT